MDESNFTGSNVILFRSRKARSSGSPALIAALEAVAGSGGDIDPLAQIRRAVARLVVAIQLLQGGEATTDAAIARSLRSTLG